MDLGLQPHYLSDVLLESMLKIILRYRDRIKEEIILPRIQWGGDHEQEKELLLRWAASY